MKTIKPYLMLLPVLLPGILMTAELKIRDIGTIHGRIISETPETLTVSNHLWPALVVPRSDILPDENARTPGSIKWLGNITLGTATFSGNNNLTTFSAGVQINRNALWKNEWDFSFILDQAWEAGSVSLRQIRSALRYGHSFSRALYGYLSSDITHDMNSHLDYRLIPVAGAGYWLADSPDAGIMLEAGIGWRRDVSADNTTRDTAVILLRSFLLFTLAKDITRSKHPLAAIPHGWEPVPC